MKSPEPGFQVREAFDSVAEVFDERYENEITRRLRASLYRTIDRLVRPASSILDISCGTGIDAVELAKRGYRVTASDISPRMIEQARAKASRLGQANIRFHTGSMEHLREIPGAPFDLVFTNFGALNCLPSLANVARSAAWLTRPEGIFLAVVMPRVCLWEIAAGMARGNASFAFRRFRSGVVATGFQNTPFTVYYYSLSALQSAFKRWFVDKGARAWCVFSPPPHATGFVARFPQLTRGLVAIDDVLARLPFLRGMGDHYLCILGRTADIAD